MNALDLVLVAFAATAAVGGYRLGFVTRVLSWAGMAVGFAIAARALPWVVEQFDQAEPTGLLTIACMVLLFGAFVGQTVGVVAGGRLGIRDPDWRAADRSLGALAGVVGVVATVWLLLPSMAHAPGFLAAQTRNSRVATFLDRTLPEPPDTMVALRRLVGEDHFPQVFSALAPAPDLGPPPATPDLGADVASAVAASTVKVTGPACGRIQEGSGFVTLGPDVVVTNAHVVAGHSSTEVERTDGQRLEATVVVFDPGRDLAVLRVPGLDAHPLPLDDGEVGDGGGVFGHPGGAPLRIAPFTVGEETDAVGTDIYDRGRQVRRILILSAALRPGDSGAALVDADGAVIGTAFAIAPDDPDVAYALDNTELTPLLAGDLSQAVDTGPCLH